MRNWKVQTPMNAQLNQETIDYMIAYVTQATGVVPPGTLEFDASLNPVHLLVKEKDFKYGKGKEYIAFTDGGKNQFGKDVKYVKFFYLYDNTGKMKPNDKTYTFGLEKARTFWNEKVSEGFTVMKNPESTQVEEKQEVTSNTNENNHLGENNE
ncbi:MAG: hypothetical protein QGH83_08555 [Candidatus Pacebacteria bacterium]|jgi:hypothetical protein|nr:hypothetical protein [Candidatus Paceibacterota bacterium]